MKDYAAILVNEPFCMSMEEVRNVDLDQLALVYFRARKEDGNLELDEPPERPRRVLNQKEIFFEFRRLQRYPEALINQLWEEEQANAKRR